MTEVAWEWEICMDISTKGTFRDPEVQILMSDDESVNANVEVMDTLMALTTPPFPFLQQPESHCPQTCPSSPQQMIQEAVDQWKQLAPSLFVHFSFQQ